MNPPSSLWPLWLALGLLLGGPVSAQATIFLGAPGGTGDVLVFPAPNSPAAHPAELQGIRLLPVDACGRTSFTEFMPGEPRLRSDVPLASRVILPQGKGSLYRFRKNHPGGADFGFFVVGASGEPTLLASFPGTGPLGLDDPIPSPVAVSPLGDGLLVGTTLAAGGDLFEIDLVSGAVYEHSGRAPLALAPEGLCLLQSWGAILTNKGPQRFARGGNTPARAVSLPRPSAALATLGQNRLGTSFTGFPGYFGAGLVKSADGSTVAIVAGASPTQTHVFVFGSSGPAMLVNDAPAQLSGAGFLSSSPAGPTLALSTDGSHVAWKTEGLSGECFTRKVPRTPVPSEVQITADVNFADTLNETGVIAFFDPNSVVLLVGETNGAGGVEKGDFFRALIPANGGPLALTNLSNTSGDAQVPFLSKGKIDTGVPMHQAPGHPGIVFFLDGSSGQGQVLRLDTVTSNLEVVRAGIAQVDLVEKAGSDFVLQVLHDQTQQEELLRIPADTSLPSQSLGLFGPTQLFSSWATNAAGTFAGAFPVTGGSLLGRIHLPTGTGGTITTPEIYGPTLGFDLSGSVQGSVVNGSHTLYFSWTTAGAVEFYPAGGATGFVLPGA